MSTDSPYTDDGGSTDGAETDEADLPPIGHDVDADAVRVAGLVKGVHAAVTDREGGLDAVDDDIDAAIEAVDGETDDVEAAVLAAWELLLRATDGLAE
jgi:hypothetical protein